MSEAKVLFSIREDKKLLEIVSKFPEIYDLTSPLYKSQTAKDNGWRKISEFVERTVDDCKKRWRNIKDTYNKRQKKGISGSSKGKKWALADMLTFLEKVDHTQDSICNVLGDNGHSGDVMLPAETETQSSSQPQDKPSQNEDDVPSLELPSKRVRHSEKFLDILDSRRRQKTIHARTEDKGDDDIDLFFKSIASSVKKFRPDLINEAKMKSLQMIIDLESRNSL